MKFDWLYNYRLRYLLRLYAPLLDFNYYNKPQLSSSSCLYLLSSTI
ncbi:hypothetical protein CGLO_14900 [Colletotrichum gloeosporioides Cg-14]|uniref:Uncharacterized protein n=1 Tax=Colletotrichum gloeosporioides (strain Cg-14) TaxID=1237896 RepID=T0L377_COLGC|nr:hypothetical protein CGLO_14900 [Colletotrichum gloeosporioides Cg-14]